MLVQPDKLLRFAEQLESIREKALLLQAEKQAVAQQAAQWQVGAQPGIAAQPAWHCYAVPLCIVTKLLDG